MKLPVPPDVYRVLAVLKAEHVSTCPGVADVLDMEEDQALRILCALCVFLWAFEQILFDGSSEYLISPKGEEVLSGSPLPMTAEGYIRLPPPTFKPTSYIQPDLL